MTAFNALPAYASITVGALALALGGAPLGVLLIERRMSLVGDSLSHGILPGAALAFVIAGPDPMALTAGALIAAVVVTGLSSLLARNGRLPEDAAFAAIYLPSLALGALIFGRSASPETLEGMLFGAPQSLDIHTLIFSVAAAAATLVTLGLVVRTGPPARQPPQMLLMMLVALNLVAGFRAFGALMTVGLMMIPAASARFWALSFKGQAVTAVGLSAVAGAVGLMLAGRFDLEPGAVMTLAAAALFAVSAAIGRERTSGHSAPSITAPLEGEGRIP